MAGRTSTPRSMPTASAEGPWADLQGGLKPRLTRDLSDAHPSRFDPGPSACAEKSFKKNRVHGGLPVGLYIGLTGVRLGVRRWWITSAPQATFTHRPGHFYTQARPLLHTGQATFTHRWITSDAPRRRILFF